VAITLGDAILYLRGDDSYLKGDLGRAEGQTRGFFSNLQRGITQGFGMAIGNAVMGGVRVASRALIGLGREALNEVANFERLEMSLESLVAKELKSADATLDMTEALELAGPRAQELLKWVEKLALESPFDQEGVASAFRTALAYGFTTEEAQRLTAAVLDAAAGMGLGTDAMGRVSLALGQMKAKGKVSGEELRQLTEAGFGVTDVLDGMGFTLDDVSKGLVDADEFILALTESMEEDFGGAGKRMEDTWAGMLNALGDLKAMGLRSFFEGLLDVVAPFVKTFTDWLQEEGIERLKEMGQRVGELAGKLAEWLPGAIERGADLWSNVLQPAMEGVWGWVETNVFPIIDDLVEWLKVKIPEAIGFVRGHWDEFKAGLIAFGAVLAGAAIIGSIAGLAAAITALLNPLVWVALAVGVLAAAWTGDWGGIRTTLTEFWYNTGLPIFNSIKEWFETNIPVAMAKLREVWENVLQPALKKMSDVWKNVVQPALAVVWDFISTSLYPLFLTLSDFYTTVFTVALTALAGIWENVLQPALVAVGDYVGDKLQPIFEALHDFWNDILKPALEKIDFLDKLKSALEGVRDAIQWVIDMLNTLIEKLKNLDLPDWMTPGSPTPWETGLVGVAAAMNDLVRGELPRLQAELGLTGQFAPVGVGGMMMAAPGGGNTSTTTNYYELQVGTLVADERGLEKLEAKLRSIRVVEDERRSS